MSQVATKMSPQAEPQTQCGVISSFNRGSYGFIQRVGQRDIFFPHKAMAVVRGNDLAGSGHARQLYQSIDANGRLEAREVRAI
jgi:hypothetical protein